MKNSFEQAQSLTTDAQLNCFGMSKSNITKTKNRKLFEKTMLLSDCGSFALRKRLSVDLLTSVLGPVSSVLNVFSRSKQMFFSYAFMNTYNRNI